jgi:hypothetical protein
MRKSFLLPMFVLGGLALFAFRPIKSETKIIRLENGNLKVEGNQLLAKELSNLKEGYTAAASYYSFRETTANYVMRSEFWNIDATGTYSESDQAFKEKLDNVIAKYN